jgi:hypothetical protein
VEGESVVFLVGEIEGGFLRDGKNGGVADSSGGCGIVFAELFVRLALGGATDGTGRHRVSVPFEERWRDAEVLARVKNGSGGALADARLTGEKWASD